VPVLTYNDKQYKSRGRVLWGRQTEITIRDEGEDFFGFAKKQGQMYVKMNPNNVCTPVRPQLAPKESFKLHLSQVLI